MKQYSQYKNNDELWLPQIPAHWDSVKIKYLFDERVEKGFPDEPLLVAAQNMGVVPKHVYGNRTVEATKDLNLLKLVRVGDFVISLRSFQGGIEYAYYQGIISPAYTIMVPRERIDPNYFRHLAKSRLFIELLQMCVTGIREGQNVDYETLKNHRIPVPPMEEQVRIAQYLDWKLNQIKGLIPYKDMTTYFSNSTAKFAKEILLIAEYRTRLVSDVVTGQVDVRDVVIPEYETVQEQADEEDDTFEDETEAEEE